MIQYDTSQIAHMFVEGVELIEQEGVTGGHVCYE
jgi:hypothetical protein